MQLKKQNIQINPENCAQCLSCMLICSFVHSKSFNPAKSYIQVRPGHFENETWIPIHIEFLDRCKPNCRLCAEYCAYGALTYQGGV